MEGMRVEFHPNGCGVIYLGKGENRLNDTFLTNLHKSLDEVERNKECKVLITTGEGKFFSNGIDLQWAMQDQRNADLLEQLYTKVRWKLFHFPIPTVAAINGHAFAGGAGLAITHDYIVMQRERGWLCWTEVLRHIRIPEHLRIFPGYKMSAKVKRDALLYAKRYTAEEAKKDELIDEVANSEDLLDVAMQVGLNALGKNIIDRDMLQTMKKDTFPLPAVQHQTKLSTTFYKAKL
ncbi:hypothetical protein FSP39_015230 [Pinctada imbricata]|uniref:Uncharacterized protein n=1 Tax=Pinctada imbricata TaxID=66713 RepID=A0AA88XPA5_PINIB|nr:hypothetical protein FSP39_015230 [Pinctada imbricata]